MLGLISWAEHTAVGYHTGRLLANVRVRTTVLLRLSNCVRLEKVPGVVWTARTNCALRMLVREVGADLVEIDQY